ncbi:MAG TPA: hypothetical protein VF584_26920 [Longimicrobium sp.]|jgi:hypothetical protein
MRKVIWTAAVLALCAAPSAAQQIEKSPFTPAPAAAQQVAEPKKEPASEDATASLRVTPEQADATIRAVAQERNGKQQQLGTNFWYTVAAVAIGVILAMLLLD